LKSAKPFYFYWALFFAIPGFLIATAVASAVAYRPIVGLTDGILPLITVLGLHYGWFAHLFAAGHFAGLPHSYAEAAEMAGANWFLRFTAIDLPLAKRAIVAAWAVVALFAYRDTAVSALLFPPGHETYAYYLLTQTANGNPHTIAALDLVALIGSIPLLFIAVRAAGIVR
jgi:ABC-type Fe3+ transport system permease subunit